MKPRLQFNRILLVLLFISVSQPKIGLRKYQKLEPGQNITGTIMAEYTSRSKLQCSDRLIQYFGRFKLITLIICFRFITVKMFSDVPEMMNVERTNTRVPDQGTAS